MTLSHPIFRHLRKLQSAAGLLGLIVMAIILSPRSTDGSLIFLQIGNLTDVLRQVSEIGIIAIAMTFVILSGGIDLSVGSMLALSASVTALALTRWAPGVGITGHIVLAVAVALAVSAAAGAVNGVVISCLRVQPFIVTLATMLGLRGLAKWLTNNTNIDFGFGNDVTAIFSNILSEKAVVIGCFAALAIIFAVLLSRTVFGRHVRAIGDNEQAAAYAGLPIAWRKIMVYTLCGLLSGLAGVVHSAQCHQGNPNDGVGYELEAIAAVVIGGTSLSGGKGSISGTIIGTLIMGILTNILRLRMVDTNVELMIKAVIIVLAVWLQSRKTTNG
ncbi:MAG: ABC transporter permease [Candidatus Sumerlaeota bacterium]|nr:ABC transporter permease [Candidatus Sumerlaeota bacterium]